MKDMNWPERVAYLENQLADSDRDNRRLREFIEGLPDGDEMASDDGFHESNVHAGVYRALVELKALRAALIDVRIRLQTAGRHPLSSVEINIIDAALQERQP